MFSKTSVAVLAGMTLAGSVLVAPGVLAAPTVGRAATWGNNVSGQLGNNSFTNSQVPVAVDTSGVLSGKTLTAISVGGFHSCAIANDKPYCWGSNLAGQLGDNSTTDSKIPVPVDTAGVLAGKTITAITAGYYHSCAIAMDRPYCWGYNPSGQLGDNSTTDSKVPVAVDTSGVLAGKTVTAISTGFYHSCAIANDRAYCWGNNTNGGLGNNSTTNSKVPIPVDTAGVLAGKTVSAISTGGFHSCAIANDRAYCWGYNPSGQLGDNSTTDSKVPVPVTGVLAGKAITAISAGDYHSCAIASDKPYCWGYNSTGQLGNNSITSSPVPVAVDTSGVLAGKTVTAISTGANHSCAIANDKPYCWGSNLAGQLGNNSTTDSKVPTAVDTAGVLAGKKVTVISTGGNHSAVLAASVPQPPTAVTGVAADAKVTVSWTPPGDDGARRSWSMWPPGSQVASPAPEAPRRARVSGLANGTGYTFTVTARNAVGNSIASAPSAPVTPTAAVDRPPGKVKGVKAKVRKHTVKDQMEVGDRR